MGRNGYIVESLDIRSELGLRLNAGHTMTGWHAREKYSGVQDTGFRRKVSTMA